jgi:ABC-type amino acid transport substrate-binding protein
MKKNSQVQELKQQVRYALKYLLEEGVAVKIGNKYRLKTQKEIAKELTDIKNAP